MVPFSCIQSFGFCSCLQTSHPRRSLEGVFLLFAQRIGKGGGCVEITCAAENGKSSDKPLLPLPKKAKKILVAGSHADNLGYRCGGWTIEWQGGSGNITGGTTILDAIRSTVDPATDVIFSKKPDADFMKSNDFSHAIVVVGEPLYNLTIPEPGPSTLKDGLRWSSSPAGPSSCRI